MRHRAGLGQFVIEVVSIEAVLIEAVLRLTWNVTVTACSPFSGGFACQHHQDTTGGRSCAGLSADRGTAVRGIRGCNARDITPCDAPATSTAPIETYQRMSGPPVVS